jgi:S-formylglutathione hydrolase FrmB
MTFRRMGLIVILSSMCAGSVLASGSIEDRSFYSSALGQTRHVMVYKPDGYNPNGTTRYPVIYFLHPANSDYNTWPLANVLYVLNSLIASGVMRPVIAAIPSGSAGSWGGSLWANSALYGRFEDYVAQDVIQFIDTNYLTIPQRAKRSLIGYSMGAMGAFNIGFRHPDLFAVTAAHSGALDYNHFQDWVPLLCGEAGGVPPYEWNPADGTLSELTFLIAGAWSPDLSLPPYFVDFPLDPYGAPVDSVYGAKWLPNGSQRLARNLLHTRIPAIYFDCGTEDELYFYPFNMAFAESLDVLRIPHLFRSYSGTHASNLTSRLMISFAFADSIMYLNSSDVSDLPQKPTQVSIRAWPNPSHSDVEIEIGMPRTGAVDLEVVDVSGRIVERIACGHQLSPGTSVVNWRAGAKHAPGIYYLRLRSSAGRATTAVVLSP